MFLHAAHDALDGERMHCRRHIAEAKSLANELAHAFPKEFASLARHWQRIHGPPSVIRSPLPPARNRVRQIARFLDGSHLAHPLPARKNGLGGPLRKGQPIPAEVGAVEGLLRKGQPVPAEIGALGGFHRKGQERAAGEQGKGSRRVGPPMLRACPVELGVKCEDGASALVR
jgi:hypothetical protein